MLVHDFGPNCIFCFTEKLFCEFGDKSVFNPDKERYCCSRTDRMSTARTKTKKGGGAIACAKGFFSKSS